MLSLVFLEVTSERVNKCEDEDSFERRRESCLCVAMDRHRSIGLREDVAVVPRVHLLGMTIRRCCHIIA